MTLGVWVDGRRIAEIAKTRNGVLRLTYSPDVITEHQSDPWISCALPVSTRPGDATLFCSGLFPEGDHRRQMAEHAGVLTTDTYGLLARFGRDVAGALVISEREPDTVPGAIEPLDDDALDAEVAGLPERTLGLHDDSELSLDGMQDKMVLVALPDGTWGRPVAGRPSTHILKVDDPRFPGLVAAEAASLNLGAAVGVTTVTATTQQLGGLETIIVSRFDRDGPNEAPIRVHQEDACQALNKDPAQLYHRRPYGKYQVGGGPTLVEIAGLLRDYAADLQDELQRLLDLVVFTTAIGNADAHGKNVGLLHPTPKHITLAPAYDTVPTALWPTLPTRAAMFINGQDELPAVTGADMALEATRWKVPYETATRRVGEMLERIHTAASDVSHDQLGAYVTTRVGQLAASLD